MPHEQLSPYSPKEDDFRTQYHPHSERATAFAPFDEYGKESDSLKSPPVSSEPWSPFPHRLDFDIGELIHEAALTKDQTNRLLSMIHRCVQGEPYTLRTHKDLESVWDSAAEKCVQVSQVV